MVNPLLNAQWINFSLDDTSLFIVFIINVECAELLLPCKRNFLPLSLAGRFPEGRLPPETKLRRGVVPLGVDPQVLGHVLLYIGSIPQIQISES